MYSSELLGAVDALFDVNDQMGVELMGAAKWNGLKKAVTKVTASALANPKTYSGKGLTAMIRKAKSNKSGSSWVDKINSKLKKTNSNIKGIESIRRIAANLNGADPLTNELFGFNDELGVELLGAKWYQKLGSAIADATHTVLNAGSKVPYISDAVSDVRSVANIFKKSSSANDSANAAIDSAGQWIKNNKVKVALIIGGTGAAIYFLTRKKKRK